MGIVTGIAISLGIAFLFFGYLIYFKGKHNLINGYEEERRAGLKDEHYARRVGLTEFIIGIALLAIGTILVII